MHGQDSIHRSLDARKVSSRGNGGGGESLVSEGNWPERGWKAKTPASGEGLTAEL